MSAPRQGYFVRAESRRGKVVLSAALAEALGPRALIRVRYGARATLAPTNQPRCGAKTRPGIERVSRLHTLGRYVRGVVNIALWEALPPSGRLEARPIAGAFVIDLGGAG